MGSGSFQCSLKDFQKDTGGLGLEGFFGGFRAGVWRLWVFLKVPQRASLTKKGSLEVEGLRFQVARCSRRVSL